MVWVFSSVFQNVHFQVVNSICCKVAQCALVRFLSSVNENVCLQIAFYIERLVALWAHVFFHIFFVGCRRPCLLENVFGHWSQDSILFITDKQNPVLSLLAGNWISVPCVVPSITLEPEVLHRWDACWRSWRTKGKPPKKDCFSRTAS